MTKPFHKVASHKPKIAKTIMSRIPAFGKRTVFHRQLTPSKLEKELRNASRKIYSGQPTIKVLEELPKKINSKISIFLGGSLAKGTVIRKKERYDVDLFIIFPEEFKEKSQQISEILEKALKKTGEKYQRLNGSRDYFQIKHENLILELVPIIEIKKSEDAKNITDISPLHVKYLLKKIKTNPKLPEEIILTKTFSYAQGVYGAESYISGFSGYSIEILTSYFDSFKKLIDFFSEIKLEKKNKEKKNRV